MLFVPTTEFAATSVQMRLKILAAVVGYEIDLAIGGIWRSWIGKNNLSSRLTGYLRCIQRQGRRSGSPRPVATMTPSAAWKDSRGLGCAARRGPTAVSRLQEPFGYPRLPRVAWRCRWYRPCR